MAALWRLCTAPVLPFDFETTAEEFVSLLKALQDKAYGAFDFGPALEKAEALKEKAAALRSESERVTERVLSQEGGSARDQLNSVAVALNGCLMKLSRILIPVSYSAVDRFESDLAVPIPPLPRLQPVAKMAAMDRQSNTFKFLERKMVRERNRICHALIEAAELIDQTLNDLNY